MQSEEDVSPEGGWEPSVESQVGADGGFVNGDMNSDESPSWWFVVRAKSGTLLHVESPSYRVHSVNFYPCKADTNAIQIA